MAQNQREINRLKHIIEEKDREIEMLKDNETGSGGVDSGIIEDFSYRIAELEGMVKELAVSNTQVALQDARINELEGMVRELAASNAQDASQDTRINELEGMVRELAVSNARAPPRNTRVNELEGMVKGLTEELLDVKAEVRKFGKVLEGKEELKPKPEIRRARPVPEKTGNRPEASSRTVQTQPVRRPAPQPEVPQEPDLGTATIMQPDGTLAEEPRKTNDDLIVAGNRPARMYQSKTTREYRGKEERKPLIYADEDDTVEIKKK